MKDLHRAFIYVVGFVVLTFFATVFYLNRAAPESTGFRLSPAAEGGKKVSRQLLLDFKNRLRLSEETLKEQISENNDILEQLSALQKDNVEIKKQNKEELQKQPSKAESGKSKEFKEFDEYEKKDLNKDSIDVPAVVEEDHKRGAATDPIGVLMFACSRVTVRQALDSLLAKRSNPEKFPVVVSQDCNHGETRRVLEEYEDQIKLIFQPDQSDIKDIPAKESKFKGYFKIARHYGWALNQMFNEFGFNQVIVVEDDLDFSPDFFEYFEAALAVLKADKSLYCVSAWNDNGKEGQIDETKPELLYRSDFFGGLGWMLTKDLWKELGPKWPKSYWDDWIRDPGQRKDRSCIRPEISRTKTFGKVGVSNGLFFDKHLKFIKLNDVKVDFKDLSYLEKSRYDEKQAAYLNQLPVVSLEDITLGIAAKKFGQSHGAVRVIYHTKTIFKKIAHRLGIMDDFKAGVPRSAYKGVVPTMYKGLRIFISPSNSWKGYDPTW